MSNIIQDLTSLVSSEILSGASSQLGESESGISKVISGLAPTILAGMLNKSTDAGAFGKIFDMIGSTSQSNPLDNLGGLLGGSSDNSGIAGGLMDTLFGDKVGGILDLVTSLAGVKKSSSSSLLGMVAPMIMGYLGKKVLKGGLNAMGLSKFLGGQRSNIAAGLPDGISDLIGFSAEAPKMATPELPKLESSTNGGGNNLFKYLLPILLLAAIYFGWKSCGDDVKNAANTTTEMVGDAASTIGDAAGDAAGAVADVAGDAVDAAGNAIAGLGDFFKRKLANGIELNIPEFGIESKLIDFVESTKALDKNTWYNFDRLTFDVGSSNIDMAKSKEQLENIASIMKAYPNLLVKIGGYTDNTGNAENNMTLSQKRADSVKAALSGLGINSERMETEGYGIAHPVASNDTEEGRAQNRRIALRVTAK